jgi:hypothetical protein
MGELGPLPKSGATYLDDAAGTVAVQPALATIKVRRISDCRIFILRCYMPWTPRRFKTVRA